VKKIVACGLALLIVPIIVLAQEDPYEGYKRYPIESAIIEYKVSGSQIGTETLYFDKYGMREAKYTDTVMMGMKRQSLTLILGQWMYNIDLGTKIGAKVETPMLKKLAEESKVKELYKSNEELMLAIGAERTGTEKIAGKACDVWEIKSANTKTWLWNWISLKTEVRMGGMEILMEAVSIKPEVEIPVSRFAVPEGAKISEGPTPPEQMMKNPQGN
jgi:hypothetical protein